MIEEMKLSDGGLPGGGHRLHDTQNEIRRKRNIKLYEKIWLLQEEEEMTRDAQRQQSVEE